MCGIVGYVGDKDAQSILLDSLDRVTYRGYDSFGVAVRNGKGIDLYKNVGTVEAGRTTIPGMIGSAGIGHTRWATVGKVSEQNAHPHQDCSGEVAIVHNGDIDNYFELKDQLEQAGHAFRSETDSEVIAHLIEDYSDLPLVDALESAVTHLEGSYAVVAMRYTTRELAVARNESPLVVGIADGEAFAASDVPAILPYTKQVIYLENGDVAQLSEQGIDVRANGQAIDRPVHQVTWDAEQLGRAGYDHYMLKEMLEQPQALRDTIAPYFEEDSATAATTGTPLPAKPGALLLLGCGTSYHACLIAKRIFDTYLSIPVDVAVATEYQTKKTVPDNALVIALSQSGETADTIEALRSAKAAGYRSMAITNVIGSSITRIADSTFYTQAGPEVAVAATKTFLSQLTALYMLGFSWAEVEEDERALLQAQLHGMPNHLRRLLSTIEDIERVGLELGRYDNQFIIARGTNTAVAFEGALKMKEVAYIHAEGCPAGELKHGPFALLDENVPVIAVVANDDQRMRVFTAMREIRARGSRVIAIASQDDAQVAAYADDVVRIPPIDPLFSPILNTVVMQLLSYYAATYRGAPIDRPRNLAKSVTVP